MDDKLEQVRELIARAQVELGSNAFSTAWRIVDLVRSYTKQTRGEVKYVFWSRILKRAHQLHRETKAKKEVVGHSVSYETVVSVASISVNRKLVREFSPSVTRSPSIVWRKAV